MYYYIICQVFLYLYLFFVVAKKIVFSEITDWTILSIEMTKKSTEKTKISPTGHF